MRQALPGDGARGCALGALALGAVLACGTGAAGETSDPGGSSGGGATAEGDGATRALGELASGEATYYTTANGEGACSFDASPGDLDIAALNAPEWASSAWCGACAEVSGPRGTARVRIVDRCPECRAGDLDLSPQAFDQIAERADGRVPIEWRFVACAVQGPLRYRYKDGSNPYWTAVRVSNSRLPIQGLAVSIRGGAFTALERTSYNYFLAADGFGMEPVRVRATARDGQVLEDELPAVQERLEIDGHSQFR